MGLSVKGFAVEVIPLGAAVAPASVGPIFVGDGAEELANGITLGRLVAITTGAAAVGANVGAEVGDDAEVATSG